MTHLLVVIYALGGVIDRVQVVKRIPDETEDELLIRAKLIAHEILDGSAFDPDEDSLTIHAVDSQSGDGHEVWNMGVEGEGGDDGGCEEEEEHGD